MKNHKMKGTICLVSKILLIIVVFGSSIQFGFNQTNENQQEDPNAGIFLTYLRNNWDDIHDVIMRFHYEDPELKGKVFIQMDWQNGSLFSASVDSNSTGNPALGKELIESMKKWNISGLADKWITTIPFKTEIVGSNQPEFPECAILTGKVIDTDGNPIQGAKLNLTSLDEINSQPTPVNTNREGIFIKTLIPSGDWSLNCTKDGYSTVTIDKLSFGMGEHVKKSIIMNQ